MYFWKLVSITTIVALAHSNIIAQGNSANDRYFQISKNLDLTTNIYKELNESYVDPIEPGKLMKLSVDGMLKGLDPYTVYISESEIEDYQLLSTGNYGGVGASVFQNKRNQFVISDPVENGPGHKAGLKSGDIMVAIDGKSLQGYTIEQLGSLLRGAPGSTLTITVKDAFSGKEEEKSIVRQNIEVPTISYSSLIGQKKNIAFVHLNQFTPNCSGMLKHALDSLKKASATPLSGVVLDLRGNPGGILDEAVNICNLFIPKGQLVVSTKGNTPEWDKKFLTKQDPWDLQIPVTVLIDGGSASASEIVSGTLQDLDRGVVIGSRSFGKGLVQVVKDIGYGAKLKITTAKYYTPSGRCIQAVDYSHKNEDGTASKFADSLQMQFKTTKGRVVYDGRGVDPDIDLHQGKNKELLDNLNENYILFDYASEYHNKNKTIAPAEQFYLSSAEFNAFKTWLKARSKDYNSVSETMVLNLKEQALKDKYNSKIIAQINALDEAIANDKMTEIEQHKAEIIPLLNQEIVGRYYLQNGKIINKLAKDDEAITKALEIIGNSAAYNDLLN